MYIHYIIIVPHNIYYFMNLLPVLKFETSHIIIINEYTFHWLYKVHFTFGEYFSVVKYRFY